MSELDSSQISCGISELFDLENSPSSTLTHAFTMSYWPYGSPEEKEIIGLDFAFVIFSDTVQRGYGSKLAAFIKSHKLGTIIPSQIKTNPNTKNKIRMWIWQINPTALERWLKKEIEIDDDADDF